MENADRILISEQQYQPGKRVRIWRQPDGRYLVENLTPTGSTSILCDSEQEADLRRIRIQA